MIDLARAFNEARLAALHIDMQSSLYKKVALPNEHPTDIAFPLVNDFAADLRGLSVTNHWVVYTSQWSYETYADFKNKVPLDRKGNEVPDLWLHDSIYAADHELVFHKAMPSVFHHKNKILQTYLENTGQRVLTIDGIKFPYCVEGSMLDAIRNGFRVYAVQDATNCPVSEFDHYKKSFMNLEGNPEVRKRITFTTREEVLNTLKFAKTPDFQGLIAA